MTMGDGAAAATAADAAFDGEANSGSTTSSTSVDGTGNANADTTATGDDGPIANANGDSTANGDGAAADGSAAADFADEDASGSAMSSTSVDGTGDAQTQAQGSVDDTVAAALGTSDANGDGAAAGTSATADFAGEDASGTAMSSTSVDGTGDAGRTARISSSVHGRGGHGGSRGILTSKVGSGRGTGSGTVSIGIRCTQCSGNSVVDRSLGLGLGISSSVHGCGGHGTSRGILIRKVSSGRSIGSGTISVGRRISIGIGNWAIISGCSSIGVGVTRSIHRRGGGGATRVSLAIKSSICCGSGGGTISHSHGVTKCKGKLVIHRTIGSTARISSSVHGRGGHGGSRGILAFSKVGSGRSISGGTISIGIHISSCKREGVIHGCTGISFT